jgi:hypothetical protein
MFAAQPRALTAAVMFAVMPSVAIPVDQDAAAARNADPAQNQPVIQFVPPATRPPLPNIDGLTPDEVSEFIGPPFATQVLKDKRLAWSYATPDGVQIVYFKPGSATATAATRPATSPAKSPAVAPLPPNGCDGMVARGPVVSLVVVMPKTPAFVTPQIREDAITTFAPFTSLKSLGTSGAWFLVTFPGARGPQSGYVHCTDVTIVPR